MWQHLEGRPLGGDQVTRVKHSWVGLVPLCKRPGNFLPSSSAWGHRDTQPIYGSGSGPLLTQYPLAPWSWTFQVPEQFELNVYGDAKSIFVIVAQMY